MKRVIVLLAIAAISIPQSAHALDTATKPAQVISISPLYTYDVASTVTLDGPGTVTLVTTAYRHPATVQARVVVGAAGTVEIRDRCKPTRLPTTWTTYVDGVKVGLSASLKCA